MPSLTVPTTPALKIAPDRARSLSRGQRRSRALQKQLTRIGEINPTRVTVKQLDIQLDF